ncbi:MAG: virulence RhuM family protein, partial [Prevotella sp.]|nr:virulence RhuM family protein [Prevotella sp.]
MGEIVMYQPDETIRLEVRVENETVWLSQAQMAELFLTTKQNVSLHVNNIFREDELEEISVVKESLTTAKDGKRYRTKLYNLDVIISVGYRVKSKRGTKFRQWANRVLKEFIIRGYVINQQVRDLEHRMDARFLKYDRQLNEIQNKIDFFVKTSLPPVEGVFYDGQIFEAYAHIINLIKQAR